MLLKPKSRVIYQPYIEKTPSGPSKILTVMHEAETMTQKTGHKMTFFHVRSAIIQRSIGCHIVRCFKMEPFDTKAGRYVLVNKLCGLR